MDPERTHGSSISDLFICFTSGHYFSRRIMVRNNSSLKSGEQKASPMFSNGKKKGPGFENPEPSSPKVTCIGQVRVNKSKKQGRKLRPCSRSNNGGNSTSQDCRRWVHLPMTICEALRAFGAEYFYCLLPCTRSSSCMANNKEDKAGGRSGEDQPRVCVSSSSPPRDALLLMRCRSDPVNMAVFADKICWETQEEQGQQEITAIKEETLTQVSSDDLEKPQEEEEGSSSTSTQERSQIECPEAMEPDPGDESKESGSQQNSLPDCLLLMMCEPKLSMEVSKETWVCSGDFIKQPLVKQKVGVDEPPAAATSCSLVADPPLVTEAITAADATGGIGSTATVVDQKPFVLTRCMSEPIRSSAKLAPNAC
ncbi:Detected protein of unknown function [Hibiscus syriacus]|uniref:Uncharacterized protein n=1 Tax=Hibiscus syriacus TaxID=106335 RepID=A0A6A2XPG1_HIBSY|nr:uncharacterized protein LOC120189250 [Hibiscus syriacus]KAE8660259.1 Detected protein of unknown function [Hibiscus syriacus]